MNIAPAHLEALQALGYTEQESRFLYIVATHSGYFTARQFLAFTGQRLAHYKLPSRLAVLREFPRNATGKARRSEIRDTFL